MLDIQALINEFGAEKTRLILQERFSHEENFWEFAGLFAHLLGDEVPDVHREWISLAMQGGKLGVGAPRGFAKSTIFGLIYLAWVALNGKKWFIPYISDTHTQAKLIAGGLKDEIETNELVQFVYPNAKSDKWGEEGFVINGLAHSTFILPLGAGMKIRGLKYKNRRPDLVVIDDLENLEIVYSAERRRKLKRWFDFDLEPAMDRYNKNIIYIGTILHYNSLLKQVLEKQGTYGGWTTRLYKALQEDGTSLWEKRFSAEYLKQIRDNPEHPDYVGSIAFAQEMQNEPQDDKDRVIKLTWLKFYSLRDMWIKETADDDEKRKWQWLNKLERVGACDPAISDKETADSFALYGYGFDAVTSNEYQLGLVHGKYPDMSDQVRLICDFIEEWKFETFGIESIAYQKGLYTLVKKELNKRRVYFCRVVPITTDKDKIRRARIHSTAFESGFIHLRKDTDNANIIKDEIEQFPLGDHDDAFDALMLARESRQKPKARTFGNNPLN